MLSSGSLIPTSASHDVEKDPAIVDHLFAEVFLVLNLLILTKSLCIIDALAPLSINILTYLGDFSASFSVTLIFLKFERVSLFLQELIPQMMGTKSSFSEELELNFLLDEGWLTRRERNDS